ncbi:MAG: hypothetical protein WB992_09710, partial [Bryobacteraceae bacterium]
MADIRSFSKAKAIQLALLGGETLLGRELQGVLEGRGTGISITGYASTGEGNFSEHEGESVYLKPLDAGSIRGDLAILTAGSLEGALKAYGLAKAAGGHPCVIDCSGHLENQPEARITAPLLEYPDPKASWLLVIAHPAASAVALVLT